MRRKIVVLLIAINLIWWVWASNWLAWLGLPAASASNPEILTSKIQPGTLRIQPLPPGTPIANDDPPGRMARCACGCPAARCVKSPARK